tara:strand:+ start:100 stop:279 length:180 start_codon:yes stop_codon:yes gene_type:complete
MVCFNVLNYQRGFSAFEDGLSLDDNPYSYRAKRKEFCEWAGGFSDAKNGFTKTILNKDL